MSDQIKHECGIAMIRLLKPLDHYRQKYGSLSYGLGKLYLMMEKQHNRGQEGAGVACIKLSGQPGNEYIFRSRAMGSRAIPDVFDEIHTAMHNAEQENLPPAETPYIGELYMGHLRYSTTGRSGISYTHPFLRRNNWRSRNLCLAGNFNMTNIDEIFYHIVSRGQFPRHNADTFIILEQLGYLLDAHVEKIYERLRADRYRGGDLSRRIELKLDLREIVAKAAPMWDGGFAMMGSTGSGDSFVVRDRWGIRPAFWYADEEVIAVASERAVIQTVFDVETSLVEELPAGHALFIRPDGSYMLDRVLPEAVVRPCSFERIYFSRGSDRDIYFERKELGQRLTPAILDAIDHDIDNTVFSFIPNTAEVAWYGMMEGLNGYLDRLKAGRIAELTHPTAEAITEILSHRIRSEKLAVKDIKLRTFIAESGSRDDLASHVYDVTYGSIRPGSDTIVVIDDSIVRGTTLRRSIVKILGRLDPKQIVVVSSSPQIRYPDCYGIDMSRMSEFIAFNAAIELLHATGRSHIIDETYLKCLAQEGLPKEEYVNHVKEIYAPFTEREISEQIARMITPEDCRCRVKVLFQSIADLHAACPGNNGDWYFSGDYPTPGGNRLVSRSFVEYYEKQVKG